MQAALVRNSFLFFLARGLPGVVNLALLAIFTRLLSPGEFGIYALAVSAAAFFYIAAFHWIGQSQLRFLPMRAEPDEVIVAAGLRGYVYGAAAAAVIGVGAYFTWPDATWRDAIPLTLILLYARAWFELNLDLLTSRTQPGRYAVLSAVRACGALAAGALFVVAGWGVMGALLGLVTGFLLAGVCLTWRDWRPVIGVAPRPALVRELLAYAYPLSLSSALAFVMGSSDRFLLAYLNDEATAGEYAAAYDLTFSGLGMLFLAVHLAAYPLATRVLERDGLSAAVQQLQINGTFLFAIGMPAALVVALLSGNIAFVVLGTEFRASAEQLIPWISLAILLAGARAYHFDIAFQLARRTGIQIALAFVAAVFNIALNLALIPRFGIMGSAYATALSFALAFALSAWVGRGYFPMPTLLRSVGNVAVACVPVGIGVSLVASFRGIEAFALQCLVAGATWVMGMWLADVSGFRQKLVNVIGTRRSRQRPGETA
ncbi:MAG TPA: polysaccharide biosynthesis C-terminal domain-containing protein [Verrucomicrobiae bacterium]|nr:polysaccharide biosynthesis C-terminal domain-containing protein [Verrucomicrobiae bacterium]